MIGIILASLVTLLGLTLLASSFYDYGYEEREKRLQNNPISFVIGADTTIRVDNSGAKTEITIYDREKVELNYVEKAATN